MQKEEKYMAKHRPHQVMCPCGNSYMGDTYYYTLKYCEKCGRWLDWDKHSRLYINDTQYQSDINERDYNDDEWSL